MLYIALSLIGIINLNKPLKRIQFFHKNIDAFISIFLFTKLEYGVEYCISNNYMQHNRLKATLVRLCEAFKKMADGAAVVVTLVAQCFLSYVSLPL